MWLSLHCWIISFAGHLIRIQLDNATALVSLNHQGGTGDLSVTGGSLDPYLGRTSSSRPVCSVHPRCSQLDMGELSMLLSVCPGPALPVEDNWYGPLDILVQQNTELVCLQIQESSSNRVLGWFHRPLHIGPTSNYSLSASDSRWEGFQATFLVLRWPKWMYFTIL